MLRSRAAKAPGMSTTHLFRAMSGRTEVALVVLDVQPGTSCIGLYEIFLATGDRNHGVGTEVLAAIEAYVIASGRGCLEVWPRTLDTGSRSDAQLQSWYRKHGFTSPQAGSDRLRKTFPQRPPP